MAYQPLDTDYHTFSTEVAYADRAKRFTIPTPERVTVDRQGRRNVQIQWKRRLFHMSSALVPLTVLALGLSTETVLWYYWPLMLLFVIPEIVRLRVPAFNDLFCRVLAPLMRPHERHSFTTGAEFAIAVYFGAALFGIENMMVAFLCLSWGDPLAAIVGLKYGHTPLWGKSLEGFMACAVTCGAIAAWFHPYQWVTIVAVGLVGAFAEIVPIRRLNDNFRIPFAVGAVLALMGYLG